MDAYHYGVSQGCSEETRLFLLGLIIDYLRERFAQGDSFFFSLVFIFVYLSQHTLKHYLGFLTRSDTNLAVLAIL